MSGNSKNVKKDTKIVLSDYEKKICDEIEKKIEEEWAVDYILDNTMTDECYMSFQMINEVSIRICKITKDIITIVFKNGTSNTHRVSYYEKEFNDKEELFDHLKQNSKLFLSKKDGQIFEINREKKKLGVEYRKKNIEFKKIMRELVELEDQINEKDEQIKEILFNDDEELNSFNIK